MKLTLNPLATVYILLPLSKGFSIYYFVLLPIFYAEKLINATALGYIGALFIVMLLVGAMSTARFLHTFETKRILQITSAIAFFSSLLLFSAVFTKSMPLLTVSYGVMGLAVGLGMAGGNRMAGELTKRGERFQTFAQIAVVMDVIRIIFPIIVSGTLLLGAFYAAIILIIIMTLIFFLLASLLPHSTTETEQTDQIAAISMRKNKNFLYTISIGFLDSMASAQLFVFLPLVFLAKGYSLESSIILQSFIFMGYLSGRLLVSYLAKKYTGSRALTFAEFGMVVAIAMLLLAENIWLLYLLSYMLGIFARGTSPAIKALAFDTLDDNQLKKGSALHVAASNSGSAFGQLLFGLMVAWFGVISPFLAAAAIALFIAIVTLVKPIRIPQE